jgi:modification methylase
VKAGETLVDERRRHKAVVRADGTLALGAIVGSIHKIGALTQGFPSCNGWTFWNVERGGKLVSIDEFRAKVRADMAA